MDLRLVRSATLRIDMPRVADARPVHGGIDLDHRASRGGQPCVLSRADLREAVDAAGVGERVVIPADGETLRR